ncbi:SRPBCC family protein [Caulobacter sp. KR2-114]|uniref:SRPBCC family protein n=1 Tax=Caulobacter sp. KR2-114 TaxID=3400912 RepID=UPI003C122DAD
MTEAPQRSAVHATFAIERDYPAPPARVFKAFADPKAKAQWFGGPEAWDQGERSMDFRVGGREVNVGGPPGGTVHRFEAVYWDIVPNERIIYAYDLHLDDRRISVSVTTIELKPTATGTHLTFTEQGAFLDGWDFPDQREAGTRELLDKLGAALGRMNADA